MFENIMNYFKKISKKQVNSSNSKDTAKERLHLVLMQDRANVSADFLDLMRQEIIDVIKKYIEVDESAIDVRLTNKENEDGTNGAPALYANIPIINIKEEARKEEVKIIKEKEEAKKESAKQEDNNKKEETPAEEIKQQEKQNNKGVTEKVKSQEQKESKKDDNIEHAEQEKDKANKTKQKKSKDENKKEEK